MRRLLKICLGAVLAALGARLAARRLFGGIREEEDQVRQAAVSRPDVTRDELYREAKRLEIEGRSKMNKRELQEAVEAAKIGGRA